MKKLTRRSYNRKIVVFGLSIFMSIAMVSTGFAAWVMSAAASQNANGSVSVGTISSTAITIDIDKWDEDEEIWSGDILSFDAVENDASGRIRAGADSEESDAQKYENLTMVISGTVSDATVAGGKVTMTITLPKGITSAITNKYLTLKSESANYAVDEATGKASFTVVLNTTQGDGMEGTFTYTLEFGWGDFFGGVNPCYFYDGEQDASDRTTGESSVSGTSISDAQMKTEMTEFRAMLVEAAEGAENVETLPYSGTIEILISASAN